MRASSLLLFLVLTTQAATAATSPKPDAVLPDGARYYGPLKHGLMDGQGKLISPMGSYKGGFKGGMLDGYGVWRTVNGLTIKGQFKNGEIVEGTYDSPQRHYQGQFRHWQFSGTGTYVDQYGNVIVGTFAHDEVVKGTWTNSHGDIYKGQFKHYTFSGQGRYTESNGDIYRGTFSQGTFNGSGEFIDTDGDHYVGQFHHWRYDGFGVYIDSDGEVYAGHFKHGYYDGWGWLTEPADQGLFPIFTVGQWVQGEKKGDTWHDRAVKVASQALYNQSHLLDAQLSALKPPDPHKINLYLVSVAGDGGEEVFRREAEFVNREFAGHFGTRGHSVVLANSRTSATRLPMATNISIKRTLKAVAGRMDPKRDILFLYLTSHGSRDHRVELDENGIELADLKAATLGKLLKSLPFRYKVVVISACFSGGFIPDLDDGHTLIITAARADRTSFGCSDENQFTYFGRAFFKDSVPQTDSFVAAFDKAKGLVGRWENKMKGVRHSYPQIKRAPAVEAQLKRWRAQFTGQPKTIAGRLPLEIH